MIQKEVIARFYGPIYVRRQLIGGLFFILVLNSLMIQTFSDYFMLKIIILPKMHYYCSDSYAEYAENVFSPTLCVSIIQN